MAKMDKGVLTGKPVTYPIPCPAGGVQMETFIPWTLVKRVCVKVIPIFSRYLSPEISRLYP